MRLRHNHLCKIEQDNGWPGNFIVCKTEQNNCPKPSDMNPGCFDLDCFSHKYEDLKNIPQLINDLFVKHIENHLGSGGEVMCKICGMTVKEVFNEMKKRADLIDLEYDTKEEIEAALNDVYGPDGWHWDSVHDTAFDIVIIDGDNNYPSAYPSAHVIFKVEGRYILK